MIMSGVTLAACTPDLTRVTRTSSNLIDYTLSNNIRDAQLTIVDYRLQILHINSPVESRNNTRSRCEINELARIAFRDNFHAMQATEWIIHDDLCNEIIRAFTTSQSKKFLKNRFRNSSPWFVEIYELLRERDFHYKRHKQFLASQHLMEAYRYAQLALKKAIVARKKQYFHDKIRRAADDSKKLWKSLNELSSKKESKQIKSLRIDNVRYQMPNG
ncbi:hypothetical protein HHI36_021698 [Cryptolaemus montrouzieri]|uniref:Lipoprotein n=1 Tax=Cryptolaemus montrouzieri TaxID=559131 RepID=A0ABD2MXZ0_9CUCU